MSASAAVGRLRWGAGLHPQAFQRVVIAEALWFTIIAKPSVSGMATLNGGGVMVRRPWGILLAATLLLSSTHLLGQAGVQHHPPESSNEYIKSLEDPGRAEWQKPEEVIEKLELKPGDSVADLGAGSGYFTVLLARAVGPAGKVYAVDIDEQMLAYIKQRAKQEHFANLQTVLADPHDPKLSPGSVDLIFICDTLHHISERAKYYPLLARALKPGGRLVNIDFQKRPLPFGPPLQMKIAKEAVVEEVKPAGFRLVKDYDLLPHQYFLVFER
jgi:arsenite methyltransferase